MSNKKAKTSDFSNNWEVLSGENDWKGLLDPLDIDLRRYLIHYGERAGAIADAFNSEKKSKNCGLSLFPPDTFFSDVGLEKGNPYKYKVTKLIYAAYGDEGSGKVFVKSEAAEAETEDSNVVGYVAVATDEGKVVLGRRDILVVWRGSLLHADWIIDFTFDHVSGKDIIGTTHSPKVHKGWYTLYMATNSTKFNKTSARDQVFTEVKNLVSKYQSEELSITVAGHSMGAAMATLNAVDMAYNKLNISPTQPTKPFPLTAFVYASPRVGDHGFSSVFTDLHKSNNLRLLRINEFLDTVPHLPPFLFGYVDVGQLLLLNILTSPYIKPFLDLVQHHSKFLPVHNLELHLHDLAGTHGIIGAFDLVIHRDLSLVNKAGDFIKDEYKEITNWWVQKNKSMAQNDDGSWALKDGWEK